MNFAVFAERKILLANNVLHNVFLRFIFFSKYWFIIISIKPISVNSG